MLWALVDLFLMERLFSQETIFFFTDYFTRDKNGFVHYRIQAFLSKKQFQNWCTLQNIQILDRTSQSTTHLIESYLLTIKKKNVVFSRSKQIPQSNTMLSQENMLTSTRIPNFARVLWVCPWDYNSEHVNIHAKRHNFNRASNFVSVPQLCTIQNTSFPDKNTPQKSSQWLL